MKKHKKALSVALDPGISLWAKCLWLLFAIAFAGLILESQLGDNFIFRYGEDYDAAIPWLYACLLPVSAIAWYSYDARNRAHDPAAQHRGSWWSWLLFYPLAAGLSASLLIYAPFGWSALIGRLAGVEPAVMEVKLIQIEHARHRIAQCDQKIIIDVDDRRVSLCAEGRVSGVSPVTGQGLLLKGRRSAFGFVVDEIHVGKLPGEGAAFKRDLIQAIEQADKIVVTEHSDRYDFLDASTDTYKEHEQLIYQTLVLSQQERFKFKRLIKAVPDRTQYMSAACIFEAHHTIRFYAKDELLSTLPVCFRCGAQEWDGSKHTPPQDIVSGLRKFIQSVDLHPEMNWWQLAQEKLRKDKAQAVD